MYYVLFNRHSLSGYYTCQIMIFRFVKNAKVGPNRWRFLVQSLQDLDDNLKKIGSRLFILKGSPTEMFKKYFKEWNVKKLTFEVDIEPYAKTRDEEIKKLADHHSVTVVTKVSHTIYDLEKLVLISKFKSMYN